MLIRFFVSNYLSFGKEAKFSMLPAPRLEQHRDKHIYSNVNSEDFKILRGALIYGGNGSGKSNFIRAINYAKNCVLNKKNMKEGDKFSISQHKALSGEPSKFEFDIKTQYGNYNYGFEITREKVEEEWLYKIFANKEDLELFYRKNNEPISIGKIPEKMSDFLKNTRIRGNQLLLNKLMDDGLAKESIEGREHFVSVYEWFKNLTVISPRTGNRMLVADVSKHQVVYDEVIKNMVSPDSSVKVVSEEVNDVTLQALPKEQLDAWNDENVCLIKDGDPSQMLTKKDGKVFASRILLNEGDLSFEFSELSDGTKRLFNLVSVLRWAMNQTMQPRVVLIDEIDRSLHPLLSVAFVNKFLNGDGNTAPVQLICTTHEVEMLNLDNVRKDEVWFTEKREGETVMSSLSDFDGVRFDTRVRNAYMVGRYNGVPFIRCPNGW